MLLALSGVVALLCCDSPNTSFTKVAEQRLTVDCRAIDFGTLPPYAQRERELQVHNHSGQSVRLIATGSNCSCLDSHTESSVLVPGDSTTWRVTLDVCEYIGEVRRQVWATTDDPAQRQLRVDVRYQVVPVVFAAPEVVALGVLGLEPREIEATADIKTLGDEPIELLAATCDDPFVEAEIETGLVTRDAPGCVRVRVYTPVPEGRYRPVVWVETTSAKVPRLRIPLYGESIGGLKCDRRAIVLEQVPLRTSQTETVAFSCEPGVRVGGMRTSNTALDVTRVERRDGQVTVTVQSNPKLKLGRFKGFLIVEVNNGQRHKVKLPFHGQVVVPPTQGPESQAATLTITKTESGAAERETERRPTR